MRITPSTGRRRTPRRLRSEWTANSQVGLTGIPVYAGVSGGLPELDISGFSQLGSPRWLPQNQFAQIWQFKDTITLIKGSSQPQGRHRVAPRRG